MAKRKKDFVILSLDGGGVRGLFTLAVLQYIEERNKGFLDRVDMVAGTSTGGIIALGIASGLGLSDMVELYYRKAKKIFDDSFLDDLFDLFGAVGAEYSNSNLEKLLLEKFGPDLTLGDLGKKVLIPAFQLKSEEPPHMWKSKYFHNFSEDDYDWYEKVYRIAMRTSAAPTYFPTYDGYIDGGVVANNPSMSALAQAISASVDMRSVKLLSIGTGLNPNLINVNDDPKKQRNWGAAQWVKPMIDIMIDGGMQDSSFFCNELLGSSFLRINEFLPKKIKMDETKKSRLKELMAWGKDTGFNRYREIDKWIKSIKG